MKKEEGRRKKEEGRRKKEEGRRKKEEGRTALLRLGMNFILAICEKPLD